LTFSSWEKLLEVDARRSAGEPVEVMVVMTAMAAKLQKRSDQAGGGGGSTEQAVRQVVGNGRDAGSKNLKVV
jgi:hypothetical protein